jgi:hypothetical protein
MTTLPQTASERQVYYAGFDAYMRQALFGEDAKPERMSRIERRGYDAAQRAQAYAETSSYLVGQGQDGDL